MISKLYIITYTEKFKNLPIRYIQFIYLYRLTYVLFTKYHLLKVCIILLTNKVPALNSGVPNSAHRISRE